MLSSDIRRKEYDESIGKGHHADFFKTTQRDRKDDFSFSFFHNRKMREEFAEEIFVDFQTYFGSEESHSTLRFIRNERS